MSAATLKLIRLECHLPPTVWRKQSEFVFSRQSGQIPAAVRVGFESCSNAQNVSNRQVEVTKLIVAFRKFVNAPKKREDQKYKEK